jgi:hypothetical protein
MPYVAGMKVIVDAYTTDQIEIWVNGILMSDEARLVVATSELELSAYLNYLVIPDREVTYEVPTILPEVLEDYIRKHSPIGHIDNDWIVFRRKIK